MNGKSLKTLEYDKILLAVAKYATGEKTRQMVMELIPDTDIENIEYMLDETDNAVVACLKYTNPPSCGLSDEDESVKRAMSGGVLTIHELLKISKLLRVCREYKNYIEDLSGFPVLAEYIQNIFCYNGLEKKIEDAILNEEELNDNASDELFSIRRTIKQTNDKIKTTLSNFTSSEKYSKYLQEQIVTTRGGRYVVPVKSEYRNEVNGLVHDSSSTGATIFIEPVAVVEANNKLRELEIKEKREVEKILANFSAQIGDVGESLLVNIEFVAKLDFAFAKGKFAVDYNCIKPEINTDGITELRKARHPLIDKKKVVPIDIKVGEDFDALIITGPNTGGKTVCLKTAGLFALMAQSGLHIPASSGSKVSVFDEVFADIGDEQSIEQNLSTFSSHMTNIAYILEHYDSKSLVLFDELGAGTDPVEGAALATAIIEEIKMCGAKVIATTHYSELKVYAMNTPGVINASCEFDVETLKPTYKLNIGIPGKSNAFAISEKLGISKNIIKKAAEHISSENIKFEDVLNQLEKNRRMAQSEKDKAERYKQEIEQRAKQIEDEKAKIAEEKEKIFESANDEAQKIIAQAKAETEKMLAEIINLRKESNEKEAIKKLELYKKELKIKGDKIDRNKINKKKQQIPGDIPKKLIPGTKVYVMDTDSNGTVLSSPDKKGNVTVQVGILKMTVHISSIRNAEVDEGEQIAKKYAMTREFSSKSSEISPEIDLRGLYAQEAVDKAEKFIDDACVSSLKKVTIVHGKGTGVLRAAIHDMLKSNRYVKSFRLGVYGEGETGVTIVELL